MYKFTFIIYWRKGCSYKEMNISQLWRGRVPFLFCLNAHENFIIWVSNPQYGTCGLPPRSSPTRLPGVSHWACLGGGAAGVTHCFHREGVQCSHTAPLHFPVHRFGWDSPPPHKDLQPLLLKRKTNRNTHNLIFTPMPSSMWSHSELATSVDLVMVRWQIQINKQGSLSGSNDDS